VVSGQGQGQSFNCFWLTGGLWIYKPSWPDWGTRRIAEISQA